MAGKIETSVIGIFVKITDLLEEYKYIFLVNPAFHKRTLTAGVWSCDTTKKKKKVSHRNDFVTNPK